MRVKDIDFTTIRNTLIHVKKEAARIQSSLGLGGLNVKQQQFFNIIDKYLDGKGFRVYYIDSFSSIEYKGQKLGHLPSLTIYNDQYKKESGGDIYIFSGYSDRKKRELLIHELIHILDYLTPTWSTNKLDKANGFMLSLSISKNVELVTELLALEVMMPIESLQCDLFDSSYGIEKIENDYRAIETSTVITWIMIHDYFYAHYAVLFQIKNDKGQDLLHRIDEHSNADSKFDIANIILNDSSIAYKSWRSGKTESGESKIDNKDYQCFCFYEKNVRQPLPSDVSSIEMIVECDKMVIVGWPKHIFDFIQRLEFKKSSPPGKSH